MILEGKETGRRVLDMSLKAGASQCEVFSIEARTSSVYVDDCIPKITDTKIEYGIGLKFVMGQKVGYTSSTLLSEGPSDVVARAKSMATVSSEDSRFSSLPEPKKVSGRYDRFLDRPTAEADGVTLLDSTMEVVNSAVCPEVTVPNGVLRASTVETTIVNSLGVDSSSKSTLVFGYFTAKSESLGKVGEGVQRCWSRSLRSIDFSRVGAELQRNALDVLKAEAFKDKWSDIVAVLVPSEGSQMLGALVGSAASGENINNRSSPWTDRIGDRIGDESLTVLDNGLSKLGMLSSVVDDEGVPSRLTRIVDKGMLKSYFFDSYNAHTLNVSPTGNGMRRQARDVHGLFTSPAKCSQTTLEVPAGERSPEDVISEIDKGVYIEHFAWPQVNALAGTFSNEIRNARLIEKGELTKNIKYALLVGNLYESLKKPVYVCSDTEVHDETVMPTLGFSGTELVGQQ